MTTERVDKKWVKQGLASFSTEALLGTLSHYGVQTDEASFKKLAETQYPFAIGAEWDRKWKGTGPFAVFPTAAALSLWERWVPEKISPQNFAQVLAVLMVALSAKLTGDTEVPTEEAFAKMSEARTKVPLNEKKEPVEAFLAEALGSFDEKSVEIFDQLAEALAGAGHVQDAEAFADLEEFLLPPRKGVSSAMVRAAKGERDAAVQDLVKLTTEEGRSNIGRLLAVDGLVHLQANSEAAESGRALMLQAEQENDLHLALDLTARLKHVYQQLNNRTGLQQLEQDVKRLEAAHDVAHPGHRAHRH